MPDMDGLELLALVRAEWPDLPVVMMTGDGSIPAVVQSMRLGAYDYLAKPFHSADEVTLTLDRALERQRLVKRNRVLERQLGIAERFEGMVGEARSMRQMFQVIEATAPTDATVLLLGESGTGKELVARAIHARSARRAGAFVPVNCSALTETLLETELFGHVRGAFSGASTNRAGMFEEASEGTLFLDEIGDISPRLQVSLLRALQEGEVKPVGSSAVRQVSTRVVAATNRDLRAAVDAGTFRADLYYRLNVVAIELPPLRDRADDIPALVHAFLQKYAARHRKNVTRVCPDVLQALQAHAWPGNIRELENVIQRAIVLATSDEITARDLPVSMRPRAAARARRVPKRETEWDRPFAEAKETVVSNFEREYIESLMARTQGNLAESARLAGMDRANFRRLARRNDIDLDRLRVD
jgi:DNA-binding NtrC family response regulator